MSNGNYDSDHKGQSDNKDNIGNNNNKHNGNSSNTSKYMAIALAGFIGLMILSLTVSIVGGIFGGLFGSFRWLNYKTISQDVTISAEGVNSITLNDLVADVKFKVSNSDGDISVSFVNVPENYTAKAANGKLVVKGSNFGINTKFNMPKIVITVPKKEYDLLVYKGIVGRTEISNLNVKEIDMEIGVGEVQLDSVIAKNAEVKGGTGNFIVENSEFDILKYSAGVGGSDLNIKLNTLADISCGVGSVSINFVNKIDEFKEITIESGLGTNRVDGVKEKDDYKNSNANGTIVLKMDGGVGSIDILFNQ